MNASPQPTTVAEELESLLDRMDMTRRDLAKETKLSLASIEQALAPDGVPTYRTQIAIEIALNMPLWSTPDHFARVKEVKAILGFVPQIESLKRLKLCARFHQVKGYGNATSKPELTNLILRELAAREKRKKELYEQMDRDFSGSDEDAASSPTENRE